MNRGSIKHLGEIILSCLNTGIWPGYYFVLTSISFCTERPSAPSAPTKVPGKGMELGKTPKTNQFLKSLEAEGEVILEDTQLSVIQSRSSSSIPPSDPITVTIEEKLNVTVERDGGVSNFDIQGTLALQVLNDIDGFLQLQVLIYIRFDFCLELSDY